MTLQFSFRHMPTSDFLVAYTKKHLAGITSHYFNEIFLMSITFLNEKQVFTAKCCAYGKKRYSFSVEDHSDNMLSAVNNMILKLKLKINRKKSRNVKNKKHAIANKNFDFKQLESAAGDEADVIDASDIIVEEISRINSSRRKSNIYRSNKFTANQSVQLKPGLRKRSNTA